MRGEVRRVALKLFEGQGEERVDAWQVYERRVEARSEAK